MAKVKACMVEELPPGAKMNVNILGRTILIANVDGRFYAVDGLCPDAGANLADGQISGFVLRCPLHGSEFDIRDGRLLKVPWTGSRTIPGLRSYPVQVEGGCVNIDVL